MSTNHSYSAMSSDELLELRSAKVEEIQSSHKEIRKLKKKFKSGSYDRQVICEYIVMAQNQIKTLTGFIEGIDRSLAEKLAPAAQR